MVEMKEVPTGVKIISVLYYIGAAISILGGIMFIVGGGILGAMFLDSVGGIFGGLYIFVGIVMIGLGVLIFFVAKGLWNAKNWARITAIVLTALSVLNTIISLTKSGNILGDIISLIIGLVIGGYLIFNEEVKQAFM